MLDLSPPAQFLISALIQGAIKALHLKQLEQHVPPSLSSEDQTKLKKYTHALKLDSLFELGATANLPAQKREKALLGSMVHQQIAETLQREFSNRSIRFVFIKGIASDARYWYQSGLRSYADLDIWVHPDDFSHCEQTLINLGYSQKAVAPPAARPINITAKSFKKEDRLGDAVIDLHRMPFDGFRAPTSWDNVWARIEKIKTPVGERMVLSPEDEIIFLAGNQLQALFAQWPKACLDLFVITQKEIINWQLLASKAKEARVSSALWALFSALISLHTPLPDWFMNEIKPKQRIQKQLGQFFNSPPKKYSQIKRYGYRIYWILSLSEDISSLRRYFLHWLPQRTLDKICS